MFDALEDGLNIALIIVFTLIFLLGLYCMTDEILAYNSAGNAGYLKYKPGHEQAEEAGTALTGYVAWLTIDGTHIDYPVMQGIDNTEFLSKAPDGTYSLTGSIFLDSNNAADFSDPVSLVYGHHMDQNRMFGELDGYLEKDWFDEHRKGLLTVGGRTYYEITFIAALRTTAGDDTIFDVAGTSAADVLSDAREKASVNEIRGGGDHLILLSTCRDTDTDVRTVVVGSLSPTEKPADADDSADTVRGRAVQAGFDILPWIILAAAVMLIIRVIRGKKKKGGNAR